MRTTTAKNDDEFPATYGFGGLQWYEHFRLPPCGKTSACLHVQPRVDGRVKRTGSVFFRSCSFPKPGRIV